MDSIFGCKYCDNELDNKIIGQEFLPVTKAMPASLYIQLVLCSQCKKESKFKFLVNFDGVN